MDIIFSASIFAAFLAGMVALFAPCCITVLLPAYLASAFREKRDVLKMTLIFFTGIAVILIPIGLGAAWLASIFQNFHSEMYIFGGLVMVILAVLAIFGKGLTMIPMAKKLVANPDVRHPKSVFFLGIFSGAATSCCAPVLAGAVTLAVISGAFWKALIVTFAYVFGMTFPLFIAAYFYDKFKLQNTRLIKGKLLEFFFRGKQIFVHSTNLLAGSIFFLMGVVLVILGIRGDAFWAPEFQVAIGSALNEWSQYIFEVFDGIPDMILGALIFGLFSFFLYKLVKK
jgi:cytochrome c-type biogenesis protein